MHSITQDRLNTLLASARGKHIAVVGDVMIDHYVWGTVARISPEAPVPVVEVESESTRLGGAANVANNIASLGGRPLLAGVVGDDANGAALRRILDADGTPSAGIITDPSRPTTIKTRVIAHHQHVVRIDSEEKRDIDAPVRRALLQALASAERLDGIIIEDYNKGVVVRDLIHEVTALARERRIPVTIDPKFNNFFEYRGVTLFKPNKKETEEALGRTLRTDDDVLAAGRTLLERLNAENVLLTRSEKGMSLFERNGAVMHIPTRARKVADVSGAGDTVIATLTLMLAAGATVAEAAFLANAAGGVVCGEVGIVPIDPASLTASVLGS
ncbi:MAG: D-glycero-beta-D-manno-heptose-7-phosphate kinase [Bacteroidetes bacterium]|nr:MAG: D-glycero-beta-D-manno-heptose-7-phosphate kinase [Bacteroidota bacterium]